MLESPALEALRSSIEELINGIVQIAELGVRTEARLSAALAYGYLKRSVKTLKAVLALSNAGLGPEAGAQARLIIEAGIFATWILQKSGQDRAPEDREARAKDVWDAEIFDDERRRRLWAEWGYGTAAAAAESAQAIEKIRQARGLLSNERFELKVANLASEAGGGMGEHYDLAYRITCLDAHPTLDALLRALRDDQEQQEFVHGRTLFITCLSGLSLAEAAFQLMGRGEEYVPLHGRVISATGFPPDMWRRVVPSR